MDYYKTTILEDWITKKYTRMGITLPSHINIKYIARRFDIFINASKLKTTHYIVGRCRVISLENGLTEEEKREAFFHEFCHIQRHAGVQSNMPNPFRELQEWDATAFTLYAAIPFHMIKYIPFEEPGCIEETARLFRVTPELAEKRISQILRRSSNYAMESFNTTKYK
ncbi:ImmA/IrrE family metallo-endopeptidase [Rossellomorea vietnamensis]|uniref:ImmA/IrrE family metallo-endopeptidase n=1 Tax=Rossellomorea vietnamensis TaxID=218284 RepID=UPI00207908D4|nr:ImmA/IrrE family metallo-endopeptidase [Rossellomorea vietnamensis]